MGSWMCSPNGSASIFVIHLLLQLNIWLSRCGIWDSCPEWLSRNRHDEWGRCEVPPVFQKHWVETSPATHLFASGGRLLRVRGLITGCDERLIICLLSLITRLSKRPAVFQDLLRFSKLLSLCVFHETVSNSVSVFLLLIFPETLLSLTQPQGRNRPTNQMRDLSSGLIRGRGKVRRV